MEGLREEIRNAGFVPKGNRYLKMCTPPAPPEFIVGLDVPLNELKQKLLQEEATVSVLTVTGPPGVGKTTLAKMFCGDDQVRGKFKQNIFYIMFGRNPKLTRIMEKLFIHNGYPMPVFQSDEDAVNQLEYLLHHIGKRDPILLVLDDVFPGSESLVDNFVFSIPSYKILVISRSTIARFGSLQVLKPLEEEDSIKLFQHSASLNQRSSNIPNDVVKKIVRGCGGFSLAITRMGRSLRNRDLVFWRKMAEDLSNGHGILDSENYVLTRLQESLDCLDPMAIECFKDLSLFPEDQRIPLVALLDLRAELHGENDEITIEKIYELVNLHMANITVTRIVASDIVDYNYHYVTRHGIFRDLSIRQTSQEPVDKRDRLIIEINGNNLPAWWRVEKEYHIAARILSISTDEVFSSKWCNLQPTEVEALILNLQQKKYTMPMFMKKMNKLKVLTITNYDLNFAEIENFELIDDLPGLKRLRVEKVSIPFPSKIGVQLEKCSFMECNVNNKFTNCNAEVSDIVSHLVEMDFDYCTMVELPVVLCSCVKLKRLRITYCHKLSALPEGIGKLVNLESLRLSSCTDLVELPDSITSLVRLKFLDISNCVNLRKLPEDMGELSNLEMLNVGGCMRLTELPASIKDLGNLKDVVCDEEMVQLWELFKQINSDLQLHVALC